MWKHSKRKSQIIIKCVLVIDKYFIHINHSGYYMYDLIYRSPAKYFAHYE
jgi:hypothetical protein